jgi:hypothetical protein
MAEAELDLDSQTPPIFTGATKQSALKEIAIACEAQLTKPFDPVTVDRFVRRMLVVAENGLQHG